MDVPVPHRQYTYEEYLQLEDFSQVKHEFFDGDIFAMTGGTPLHAALAARIIFALKSGLPDGYEVFTSDLRVQIPSTGLSTYPDVAVVAGKLVLASIDPKATVNPVMLVEVTSPSTETYDREKKLAHYQQLVSLRHVLFVSHREPRLTLVTREHDGTWSTQDATEGRSLELPALATRVSVDDLYRGAFEPAP